VVNLVIGVIHGGMVSEARAEPGGTGIAGGAGLRFGPSRRPGRLATRLIGAAMVGWGIAIVVAFPVMLFLSAPIYIVVGAWLVASRTHVLKAERVILAGASLVACGAILIYCGFYFGFPLCAPVGSAGIAFGAVHIAYGVTLVGPRRIADGVQESAAWMATAARRLVGK